MRLFSQISFAALTIALTFPAYSQEKAGTTLFKALTSAIKTKEANHKKYDEAKGKYPPIVSTCTAECAGNYQGNVARPGTPTGGLLKPFNAGSSYVVNGQVVYKHNNTVFRELTPPPNTDPFTDAPDLPPLPDLRTPEQISKQEKRRAKLQKRYAERRLREAALRAANGL